MAEALKVEKRTALGKNSVKKLRSRGVVPGVVYGKGNENAPIQLDRGKLMSFLERSGRVADLVFDGRDLKAVIKEVQHNIFTDDILHVDFQLVSMTEKITLPVAVVLAGELSFTPDQGTLEQILTEVEVECLPKDAPGELSVNISGLEPGDSIHASDIDMPRSVVLVTPGEEMVATVARPMAEEEEVPAEEAEELKEPEVIGEHKKEEKEPEQD